MPNSAKYSKDIAIIGMSCRFPGGADNPELYWSVLLNGKDVIGKIPKERWDADEIYDPNSNAQGKIYTKHGGFLNEIDKFDNNFFRISPVEAESLDPQIRLLLELSYEAIEDGGLILGDLKGSKTGVYIGISIIDYIKKNLRSHDPSSINSYSVTGTSAASASGRISYAYDLRGPSVSIDTACSSSLVAIHLACQSLSSGETNLVIAGGANIILSPEYHIGFCRLGALSPDGHCKAFDASANGFVRSEGGGIILLKRLEDAIRDKDNILGVVAGSCVNNDGSGNGFTAPNPVAQEDAIKQALAVSGISPDDVSYIETHGTGTKVGDPIELEAIGNVFVNRAEKVDNLIIGSVKTVIGHTESAAGMAGLVKILLGFKNETIPANDHFVTPNPAIDWKKYPITVASHPFKWLRKNGNRIAGISAFGLSGTNAHILIKEPPRFSENSKLNEKTNTILAISAKSKESLKSNASKYLELIKKSDENEILQIAKNASLKRTHFEYRIAINGKSKEDLVRELEYFIDSREAILNRSEEKDVVFVFPGQGSQWVGMGRELIRTEKAFRDSIENCEKVFSQYVEWSLSEELTKDEEHTRFSEVDIIQPIIFAIQVSLARLWMSFGVTPKLVIGHSMGEIAASHIAGALTLDDAAKIICLRSKLAKRISGKGAMAVVELSMDEVNKILKAYENDVSIAASNGPKSVILSGDINSINQILLTLGEQGIFCRAIKVDFASHSPQIDLIKNELIEGLRGISPKNSSIPIYSTVLNELCDGSNLDQYYWSDNIRKPVLFSQAIQKIVIEGGAMFLEVSPHPVLTTFIEQCIDVYGKGENHSFANKSWNTVGSLIRDKNEKDEFLNVFCYLYMQGVSINWRKFYGPLSITERKSLPSYVWEKESYWLKDSKYLGIDSKFGTKGHPFLYNYIKYKSIDTIHFWTLSLNVEVTPFLKDHVVNETVLFPAAAYIELIQAAIINIYGEGDYIIQNMVFNQPLVLTDGTSKEAQLSLIHNGFSKSSFKLSDAVNSQSKIEAISYLSGDINLESESNFAESELIRNKKFLDNKDFISEKEHYSLCDQKGLHYGKCFRAVRGIWRTDKMVIGKIVIDSSILNLNNFIIHPAILDACFQVAINTISSNNDTIVPGTVELIAFRKEMKFGETLFVQCEKVDSDEDEFYLRNLSVFDEHGEELIRFRGFKLNRIVNKNSHIESTAECLFTATWQQYTPTLNHEIVTKGRPYLIFASEKQHGIELVRELAEIKVPLILVYKGDRFSKVEDGENISFTINPTLPSDFEKLLETLNSLREFNVDRIIYMWGIDLVINSLLPFDSEDDFACMGIVHLMQELSKFELKPCPRLFIVTTGSQQVSLDDTELSIEQSPLWGLGRVIFHEFHEFQCTRVDLSHAFAHIEIKNLIEVICNENNETELSLRNLNLFRARLIRSEAFKSEGVEPIGVTIPYVENTPYQVVTDNPGIFDNLSIKESIREPLSKGEVEVEVKASGLNFINVMSALGIYPGYKNGYRSLGIEFSGKITSIDESVTEFKVGDEVFGCGEECIGKYIRVNPGLIVRKPPEINFEDAAAIPIAFLTAYYSLIIKGHLKKGESILIHSASGGVGLAAIQIAHSIGAKVFATAGTEEKRSYLKSLGVELVMNSRTLLFVDEIRKYNDGRGVDVVLNSLTGEALFHSIRLLEPFGRFLEIGKKDVYDNSKIGLDVFKNSISFIFIDLDMTLKERSSEIKIILQEVLDKFKQRIFAPINKKVFPVANVIEGFVFMARGAHIGKIVFAIDDKNLSLIPIKKQEKMFDEKDTFLITGGLGGLGLELAAWLISNGVKNLVLVSRSGETRKSSNRLELFRRQGINILIKKVNVSDFENLKIVINEVNMLMPPIKGIVHAAGVLEDVSLQKLVRDKFKKAVEPKIHGGWNLHLLSMNENIKWFIVYSSAASLLGSSGQGNYVAGNSFLDSLCQYRLAQGLPAKSINWGPISEIGLAAEKDNRGKRLESEGIHSFDQKEHLELLEILFKGNLNQFTAMRINLSKWLMHNTSYLKESLFYGLSGDRNAFQNKADGLIGRLFSCASLNESQTLLKERLMEIISQILKITKSKIETDIPFVNLGLDSLMAIQFKNRLEKDLGISISVTTFWNYPTIDILTNYLLNKTGMHEFFEVSSDGPRERIDIDYDSMTVDQINSELDKEFKHIF
jgi:acyl transferase domain-containing protein/NADPH:quinone reductase-like Zn-dependent oxidoreductase/acyl carrier protein/NADP-dependent 3-hydroxy acid dehydrogenase YdfG